MAEDQSKLIFHNWNGKKYPLLLPGTDLSYKSKRKLACTLLQDLAYNMKRLRNNTAILWFLQVHLNGIPPSELIENLSIPF